MDHIVTATVIANSSLNVIERCAGMPTLLKDAESHERSNRPPNEVLQAWVYKCTHALVSHCSSYSVVEETAAVPS